MTKRQGEGLPEFFRSLLWSYRFEDMERQPHKNVIVLQAINYGTLAHWRWIVRTYTKVEVRRILVTIPASSLRRHVRKLVSILFDITEAEFNHAPRGTNSKQR